MERVRPGGVVTGDGPQVDVVAAGHPVQAWLTLEIAQGRLDDITELLDSLRGVLETYASTGDGDVVCRLAAESNEQLQQLLLTLNKSETIRRSTSVVILSVVVPPRTLPLLLRRRRVDPSRTRTLTAP